MIKALFSTVDLLTSNMAELDRILHTSTFRKDSFCSLSTWIAIVNSSSVVNDPGGSPIIWWKVNLFNATNKKKNNQLLPSNKL